MHIIMFNELENHLEIFKKREDTFFDNLFEWSKMLEGEDLEASQKMKKIFSVFFEEVKEHLTQVRYLIGHTDVDSDLASFTSFLEAITPPSEKIFSRHEKLKGKLQLFDDEFKKIYRENQSEDNDLKNLVLARDGMYISKIISCYYQTMMSYFESEMLVSNFIDKTKKFLLKKKHN